MIPLILGVGQAAGIRSSHTRYRAFADTDGNGYIEGRDELFPLYLAAAQDFTQPLLAYGPPRLVRLGVEFLF